MAIEIRDAALEVRIQRHLEASGSSSVEELILRLLDTQDEHDKWLLANREFVRGKIERGIAQLDRGEGIPDEKLDQYSAERKRKSRDVKRILDDRL
jgi:hypothetical protein